MQVRSKTTLALRHLTRICWRDWCGFGVKQWLYCTNYRVSVGVIDVSSEQKQRLYCANYRVAVGVVDANSEQKQRLHWANYRVAVVGAMPLVRTWVITDDLFSLADLLYLSHDGIASFYASCMIIFGLATFFASYNLFTFSPFYLSFPYPTKRPTAMR